MNARCLSEGVKERPILFSGPMVEAILDGRKTQTRRAVKPQPTSDALEAAIVNGGMSDGVWCWLTGADMHDVSGVIADFRCPYGVPGSKLWVRETFHAESRDTIHYRADGFQYEDDPKSGWKPSIFMPRWASRITLDVHDIRVERLQNISAKDIIAEGAVVRAHDDQFGHNPVSAFDGKVYLDLQSLWAAGWDGINVKRGYSWASNPWCWCISFARQLPA